MVPLFLYFIFFLMALSLTLLLPFFFVHFRPSCRAPPWSPLVTGSDWSRLVSYVRRAHASRHVGTWKKTKQKKKEEKTEDMVSPVGGGEETNLKENFLKGKKKSLIRMTTGKKKKWKNQMINIKARIRWLQLRNFVNRTNQDSRFLFKKKKKNSTQKDVVVYGILSRLMFWMDRSQPNDVSCQQTLSLSLSLQNTKRIE